MTDMVNGQITRAVLTEVLAERAAQDVKFGPQNHPDGTGPRTRHGIGLDYAEVIARRAKWVCQRAARDGQVTWMQVLAEEFWEAVAEEDPARLRAELIQISAVCAAWCEAIDRRTQPGPVT